MRKEKLFSFSVSTGNYSDYVKAIIDLSANRQSSYVCFANAHMAVEAYYDPEFNNVVNSADIVAPDGKPLSIFLYFRKGIRQQRAAGMDIFPDILKEAAAQNKSVFFYGSTDDVLEKIKIKAEKEFPKLNISGLHSPPFRPLSQLEKQNVVKMINASNPDLIFVSLGCPKQEKWMAEHQHQIRGCMLGLGQAFRIYAGVETRSPRWMQKLALEWLFRLLLEPSRLWKRYLVTNSQFLYLSLLHLLKYKLNFKASKM